MSGLRLVDRLDPSFAWDGHELYRPGAFAVGAPVPEGLRGAAASVKGEAADGWRLLRDPLGINKLFWATHPDGTILVAARPFRLIAAGCPFEDIRAIPRGTVVDLDPGASEPAVHSLRRVPSLPAGLAGVDVETVAREIRELLDRYLAALRRACPAAQVFVCLSGGLDSSGIAVLAREHFADVVAVSFDLQRGGRPSDDRVAARRLAHVLGLELLEATVDDDELLEALDLVLVEGIDWRDFNVHAGLVNAALARAVSEVVTAGDRESAIVLTGDLANEFLADYGPERYRAVTYYALPSVPPSQLRASLVQGLDTSNREIGVFAVWNLAVVQPYAAAADAYLALPEAFLALEDRKQRLCRAVFGRLLPEHVYLRPKVRAQLGSSGRDGGVLGACVDHGIDATWLTERFARLHGVDDRARLGWFIRAGRYKTGVPRLQN